MAAVVPFASCYASVQPLQLFGRRPGRGNYLLLLPHRGPGFDPRPRLACHAPRMSLRQICLMLKVMKQVRSREAAATTAANTAAGAAAANRKQGSAAPGTKSEKKCVLSCLRHKRSIKRVG